MVALVMGREAVAGMVLPAAVFPARGPLMRQGGMAGAPPR